MRNTLIGCFGKTHLYIFHHKHFTQKQIKNQGKYWNLQAVWFEFLLLYYDIMFLTNQLSSKVINFYLFTLENRYLHIFTYIHIKKNIKCSKNLFSLLNVKQRYCIINMLTKRKPFGFVHWLLLLLRNILINPNKKKNVNDLLKCFWRQITIFSESLHPNLRS